MLYLSITSVNFFLKISGDDTALYCQLRNDVGQLRNNNDCYVVDCYVVEVFSFFHQYLLLIPLDRKFFLYYGNKTLFCFYWLKGFFLEKLHLDFILPVTKWTCPIYTHDLPNYVKFFL